MDGACLLRRQFAMTERQHGARAAIDEGHRHQRLAIDDAGAFARVGEDQALGRHHLAIDALLADQPAVRRPQPAAPGAARPHVHRAGERGVVARRPPAGDQPLVRPRREQGRARRRELAPHVDFQGGRLEGERHESFWNSTSITISIESPNSGSRPKSTGLMVPRALTPMRGRSAKPLPAPTSSTSNVTGLVLPISVSWPSTLPRRVLIGRKALDTKVASGKAADFRELLPGGSRAQPLTLEVVSPRS